MTQFVHFCVGDTRIERLSMLYLVLLEPEQQRSLLEYSERGASSWLGAIPIAKQGFCFNKSEFQDALCLRYSMEIRNLPNKCPCTQNFNVTHALNCKLGGFVNVRHNSIRNLECKLLQAVCRDVECEPPLLRRSRKTDCKTTNGLQSPQMMHVWIFGLGDSGGRDRMRFSTCG